MVPGMTERERIAADIRRAEWLADAVLGPVQASEQSAQPTSQFDRAQHPVVSWALAIPRRLGNLVSGSARKVTGQAGAQSR